jgi:ABC-type polysaccharide/polyol phosphate export permease
MLALATAKKWIVFWRISNLEQSFMNLVQKQAWEDLVLGAKNVRGWWLLARDDLKSRYARTVLGPFWMVLAQAMFVGALSFWSATLTGKDIGKQILYVAAGMAVWSTVATSIIDASGIMLRAASFVSTYRLPISLHIHRFVIGQFITMAHLLSVYVVAAVVFAVPLNANTLLFFPGVIVTYIAMIGWSLALSMYGARYRDIAPLSSAVLGALFILTPIFWRREDIAAASWMADINPLFHILQLTRAPLLGEAPTMHNWVGAVVVAAISLAFGVYTFLNRRKDINFWI